MFCAAEMRQRLYAMPALAYEQARQGWLMRSGWAWRGGREAEGGGLLNRYTGLTGIVGSNPISSAIFLIC